MVDEKFELISVIFRLAGKENYTDLETDYHKNVAERFAKFSEHPAVKLIKSFDFSNGIWVGHSDTLRFIAHLEKRNDKFVFIEDISSLFDVDGSWNEVSAKEFLELFNDFYNDTDYAEFFNSCAAYFEEVTQYFINETYGAIDFEWFRKYVDPSNLRCIYSPSSGNYGATVNNKIVYSVVRKNGSAFVHECCHHIASKLVDDWYNENEEFRKWCDDGAKIIPVYSTGWVMANEYITRAYDVLYKVQHGGNLEKCLANERDGIVKDGFKHIGEVYNMVSLL